MQRPHEGPKEETPPYASVLSAAVGQRVEAPTQPQLATL